MPHKREFDLIVWGATGYTGKLVIEQYAKTYLVRKTQSVLLYIVQHLNCCIRRERVGVWKEGKIKLAVGGRSRDRLVKALAVVAELTGIPETNSIPVVVADPETEGSLESMTARCAAVISLAGPFGTQGMHLVDAAVKTKTHYSDINGEPRFSQDVVERHARTAREAGVRVVTNCGFDSFPHDLGTWLAVQTAKDLGRPAKTVTEVVLDAQQPSSGSTMHAIADTCEYFAELGEGQHDAYSMIPQEARKNKRTMLETIEYFVPHQSWVVPFLMQKSDARIMQRSNYLLGYHPDFVARQVHAKANLVAAWISQALYVVFGYLFQFAWARNAVLRGAPMGSGPERKTLEKGTIFLCWYAQDEKDEPVVRADFTYLEGDAGYLFTSRLLLEVGLALSRDLDELDKTPGILKEGVLTPSAAFGQYGVGLLHKLNGHLIARTLLAKWDV
ncbi:hypothetical protein H632_c634p1 [Helicosporidium sp. ATCC 50920]|nr:hypothetical protein H632_c634p1 [Helicosporidium sp. ATCC 50920]|eukprot:KDD75534.1 hypothetical protein H632_c634p1 [Helicosporidium sp. ATCC 50920]